MIQHMGLLASDIVRPSGVSKAFADAAFERILDRSSEVVKAWLSCDIIPSAQRAGVVVETQGIPGFVLGTGREMRIRFGDCLFESATRQLLVQGRSVHLQPKAFQLLELLLERRPAAVDKKAIHGRLWPDTFVADGTVTSLVAEVRDAIGDDGREPRFIRTVHRFGYAFFGEGKELRADAQPRGRFGVWLVQSRRNLPLDAGETIVGRDPGSPVHIDDSSVSRRHARIFVAAESVTIEDLASKNGTFVGGMRVGRAVPLADGDLIRVGSVPLTVRIFDLPDSTETGAEDSGS